MQIPDRRFPLRTGENCKTCGFRDGNFCRLGEVPKYAGELARLRVRLTMGPNWPRINDDWQDRPCAYWKPPEEAQKLLRQAEEEKQKRKEEEDGIPF